jgi:hypothetical protein
LTRGPIVNQAPRCLQKNLQKCQYIGELAGRTARDPATPAHGVENRPAFQGVDPGVELENSLKDK